MLSQPSAQQGRSAAARRVRRRVSRRQKPVVVPLEARNLMSVAAAATTASAGYSPTDAEQYMLELINRARQNPAVEAQRLASLARTDPILISMTSGWNLNQFVQLMSNIAPEPPLAFNTRLIEAARDHNAAMLAANSQFHAPAGYLTNPSIAKADDGQAYYPTSSANNAWWSTGENIFAYSGNLGSASPTDVVNYFAAAFLIDWGNPNYGHLKNVLAPGPGGWAPGAAHFPYTEVGVGLMTDVAPTTPPPTNSPIAANRGLNVGPDLISEEFAFRSGVTFLTGCFFQDLDGNAFYSPGEGLGGVSIRAIGRNNQGVFQASTWSSGGYSLQLPPGSYDVTASGGALATPQRTVVTVRSDNVFWEYSQQVADLPVPADYNGDGRTDVAVYRAGSSTLFVRGATAPTRLNAPPNAVAVPGDYLGLGQAEPAVFCPSTCRWLVSGPTGMVDLGVFGGVGIDIPVPGDYDGLGQTEIAVYRPSTGQWFVKGPGGSRLAGVLGAPNTDVPVPGDYDGTGHTQLAVYSPTTGNWFVAGPNGPRWLGFFGLPNVDIPVPGDYDGVGHTELAVYRPTTGQFFIRSPGGWRAVSVGQASLDVPVRGDFDGDGRADPAVYRSSTAQWFGVLSGGEILSQQYGMAGLAPPAKGWQSLWPSHPLTVGPYIVPSLSAKSVDVAIVPRAASSAEPVARRTAVHTLATKHQNNRLLKWVDDAGAIAKARSRVH